MIRDERGKSVHEIVISQDDQLRFNVCYLFIKHKILTEEENADTRLYVTLSEYSSLDHFGHIGI